ncbi:MAG: carbamoyltransferase HypF [Cyanobacteriota bacterium]|nr:carbamoyltransferase HypF [Cyanobacteriota bacterium]
MTLNRLVPTLNPNVTEEIRVFGTVQGVGFRPTVYRLANECGLCGEVSNDGSGVLILVTGDRETLDNFVQRLQQEQPPLANIESIVRRQDRDRNFSNFRIISSTPSAIRTQIAPDAATCPACKGETFDASSRWYRYPFTNCTHCGPRLSLIQKLPYDRANTSMAAFTLCPGCQQDYETPTNRRFHAQPTACPTCGPRVWLERADGNPCNLSHSDAISAVLPLLQGGNIVAIKGLGGFHLACDATNAEVVGKLRDRKHRPDKPLALMARDVKVISQCCLLTEAEKELLQSSAAPIVLLKKKEECDRAFILPENIAPGLNIVGFMLPYTPLHHLLMENCDRPLVFTSGNRSGEPQCIGNEEARQKLSQIADYFLLHNREIINRIDDSVARVILLGKVEGRGQKAEGEGTINKKEESYGVERRKKSASECKINSATNIFLTHKAQSSKSDRIQILRRARGYAPAPISLPPGFEKASPILAMGSELKNTFCLLRQGQAILSQHLGDLENASASRAYQESLNLYLQLFEHQPTTIAIDRHPEYQSSKLGKELACANSLNLEIVQHHHAHVAACMADNGISLDAPPVLGIALDGLGYGEDGILWGGEFLLADYRNFQRLATFKPITMLGGEQAIYQPWRSTYAHLREAGIMPSLAKRVGGKGNLELFRFLQQKPLKILDRMAEKRINSPLASSCGRLFDAVAAAMGICRESCHYEGQGAMQLETLAYGYILNNSEEIESYPFSVGQIEGVQLPYLEPQPMWEVLLDDLYEGTDLSLIAAKFHLGLADAIAAMVSFLQNCVSFCQVVLTGGVFQNYILLKLVRDRLESQKLEVLTHRQVPPNDGGLSLGQGAIACARQ